MLYDELKLSFSKDHNKYLQMGKGKLVKLCKDNGLDAEFNDELEDLAFLAHRVELYNLKDYAEIEALLEKRELAPGKNLKEHILQLVTYELSLVMLYESEEEEIIESCDEFEMSYDKDNLEEILHKLAVAYTNC